MTTAVVGLTATTDSEDGRGRKEDTQTGDNNGLLPLPLPL